MLLDMNLLNLYAKNNFNVLLKGRHGTGKTEIIKTIFNNNFGDRWVYFSASTMDAWVDLIGVPKAVTREDGTDVLKLIPPARFADDNVEAIFFDEYNRSPIKVRNAVMELIQFKSINGRKFNNLKVVWAAINPHNEEGTYDVEEIDPAQLDRFPIKIDMPYQLDKQYFKNKYGFSSQPFIEWWTSLSEDLRYSISPRLLDNSIEIYQVGGDLKHVLPIQSNISNLIQRIQSVSLDDEWKNFATLLPEEKSLFFKNLGNISKFKSYILKELDKVIQYIPQDYIMNQVITKDLEWLKEIRSCKNVPSEIKTEVESTFSQPFEAVIKELIYSLSNSAALNLQGKTVVLTGKFSLNYSNGNTQGDIETLLSRIGAFVTNTVTKKTQFIINANDVKSPSSKVIKAQNLSIPIISEYDFHKVYGAF